VRLEHRPGHVRAGLLPGLDNGGVRRPDGGRGGEPDLDPAEVALVRDPVGGELDHHRVADRVGRRDGGVGAGDQHGRHDRDPVRGREGRRPVLRPGRARLIRHLERGLGDRNRNLIRVNGGSGRQRRPVGL